MPEELTTQLAEVCPFWTAKEWADFLAMSLEDQLLVAHGLEESATPPSASGGWATALKVLETTAAVVGAVTGIASGVVAIKAIIRGA